MYIAFKAVHSLWAFLVVLMILVAIVDAFRGWVWKKDFGFKDLRIFLFTVIVTHLQILLGIILFFLSPKIQWFSGKVDTGTIMKDASLRFFNLEHPVMMVLAVVAITVGFSRQRTKIYSGIKFRTVFFYYLSALVLFILGIPWSVWL